MNKFVANKFAALIKGKTAGTCAVYALRERVVMEEENEAAGQTAAGAGEASQVATQQAKGAGAVPQSANEAQEAQAAWEAISSRLEAQGDSATHSPQAQGAKDGDEAQDTREDDKPDQGTDAPLAQLSQTEDSTFDEKEGGAQGAADAIPHTPQAQGAKDGGEAQDTREDDKPAQGGESVAHDASSTPDEMEDEAEDESGEDEISFADLGLDEVTLQAVVKKGFRFPSSIQIQTIPRLLSGDANIIAKARTGTGKTAAFGLPLVQQLRSASDHVRAIILEPTRELALQTAGEMASFAAGRYPRVAVVYGGASIAEQMQQLRRGVEVVVGTPGRVQDLIDRGALNIGQVDYFILDEGDEMLDMGFIEDIEAIFECANPDARVLLFSATVPKEILNIAEEFMGDFEIIEEEGYVEEALPINQKYWVVREGEKIEALVRLIDISDGFYGLVFVQRKSDADVVAKSLDERGYQVAALHGDIAQAQREKILERFRAKKTRVLVATDVAARGIDIEGLTHVVNYELPFDAQTYIHRIGRTGRAGAAGAAVTFVRPEETRRKMAYLIRAVKKSAKGEVVQEQVPSVEEVIEVRKSRLFDDIKHKLGLSTKDEGGEVLLRKADPIFDKLAHQLCSGQDAEAVVASLLSVSYGKEVSKSRYGRVGTYPQQHEREQGRGNWRDRGGRGARGGSFVREGQLRLYVQMGWDDGYNPRKIADFFHDLLGVPGRKVDAIDMADRFCLLSLPADDARRALELSRGDRSLPHMHLDTKVQLPATRTSFERSYRREERGDDWDSRGRRRGFASEREAVRRREHSPRAKSSSQMHTGTQRNTSSSFFKRADKFQEY